MLCPVSRTSSVQIANQSSLPCCNSICWSVKSCGRSTAFSFREEPREVCGSCIHSIIALEKQRRHCDWKVGFVHRYLCEKGNKMGLKKVKGEFSQDPCQDTETSLVLFVFGCNHRCGKSVLDKRMLRSNPNHRSSTQSNH